MAVALRLSKMPRVKALERMLSEVFDKVFFKEREV